MRRDVYIQSVRGCNGPAGGMRSWDQKLTQKVQCKKVDVWTQPRDARGLSARKRNKKGVTVKTRGGSGFLICDRKGVERKDTARGRERHAGRNPDFTGIDSIFVRGTRQPCLPLPGSLAGRQLHAEELAAV